MQYLQNLLQDFNVHMSFILKHLLSFAIYLLAVLGRRLVTLDKSCTCYNLAINYKCFSFYLTLGDNIYTLTH